VADFLKIADRSWRVLGPLFRAHGVLYRATGGRLGGRLPGRPPTLVLDHIGARSGKPRTTPLIYMPVEANFLIVAAKGGHPKNPSWLYNLRAHPDTDYGRSPPSTTRTGITTSAALRGRSRW
jgi:F420H(2)-dependent quinone reductase